MHVVSYNIEMVMMMTTTTMMMLQLNDSWKSLCDWLDVQEQKLRQLSSNTAKMKHDLEELQVPSITPVKSHFTAAFILEFALVC